MPKRTITLEEDHIAFLTRFKKDLSSCIELQTEEKGLLVEYSLKEIKGLFTFEDCLFIFDILKGFKKGLLNMTYEAFISAFEIRCQMDNKPEILPKIQSLTFGQFIALKDLFMENIIKLKMKPITPEDMEEIL